MASDSLLKVIAGLVKREGRIAREDAKKAKEALKAEAEKDEEEDEDEDPVGTSEVPEPDDDSEGEWEPPAAEPDSGEGDTKPTGPDPALVAQVAKIVKQEIEDEAEKNKKPGEIKLSGKKEKIDTKPQMEQRNTMKLSLKEAIRLSVTGTQLTEGYEEAVLGVLEDASIDGPLGYEPFFEKGKLFVEKGSERAAKKALQQSRDISKLPKIIGEILDPEEYLAMESVDVDGRCKGFKQALRRLTYEKIKQIKKSLEKDIKESGEYTSYWLPEGLSKEGAAEFMAAASAAKREGKKKFKFGGKEYPVTIKVDIPLKGEQKEGRLTSKENELVESIMSLNDKDYDKLLTESTEVQIEGLGGLLGKALGGLGKMGKWMVGFDDEIASKKKADKAEARLKKAKAIAINKDRLKKAQDELNKLDAFEKSKNPDLAAAQDAVTDYDKEMNDHSKKQAKELAKAKEDGEPGIEDVEQEVETTSKIKVPEVVKGPPGSAPSAKDKEDAEKGGKKWQNDGTDDAPKWVTVDKEKEGEPGGENEPSAEVKAASKEAGKKWVNDGNEEKPNWKEVPDEGEGGDEPGGKVEPSAERKAKDKEAGGEWYNDGTPDAPDWKTRPYIEKDDKGNIKNAKDAEDYAKEKGKSPPGWKREDPADPKSKLVPSAESLKKTIGRIVNESNELQAIMALDDEGIDAEINRKGQVSVKKKDLKKAEKALKKSFKKGGQPDLVGEEVETDEVDEMKMSAALKKKKDKWAKSSAGKASLKKSAKRAKKVASGSIKIDKAKGRAMAKARARGGIRNEFELDEALKPKDKLTVDTFYYRKSRKSNLLSTNGNKLEKLGMGGQTIAKWNKSGKIEILAVTDVKSTESILTYMKKSIPKGNFDPKSYKLFFGEELQRTAYEIVSEARKNAIANKPKWEQE